jgi:hypothetical protein
MRGAIMIHQVKSARIRSGRVRSERMRPDEVDRTSPWRSGSPGRRCSVCRRRSSSSASGGACGLSPAGSRSRLEGAAFSSAAARRRRQKRRRRRRRRQHRFRKSEHLQLARQAAIGLSMLGWTTLPMQAPGSVGSVGSAAPSGEVAEVTSMSPGDPATICVMYFGFVYTEPPEQGRPSLSSLKSAPLD